MGSNPCRIIPLLGIAYPVEGNYFKYREYPGRRRSLEAEIMKRAELWP